jgi:hypothetical protein
VHKCSTHAKLETCIAVLCVSCHLQVVMCRVEAPAKNSQRSACFLDIGFGMRSHAQRTTCVRAHLRDESAWPLHRLRGARCAVHARFVRSDLSVRAMQGRGGNAMPTCSTTYAFSMKARCSGSICCICADHESGLPLAPHPASTRCCTYPVWYITRYQRSSQRHGARSSPGSCLNC